MMKIAVIGNINFDVNAISSISENTEENRIKEIKISLGGTAANTAISLSNLGINVDIYGAVGNDEFGKILIQKLNKYKINTEFITIKDETKTGFCFIDVKKDGRRHLSTYRGANEEYFPDLKKKYDLVHLAGLGTIQAEYILNQKDKYEEASYNPGGIVTFEQSKNIMDLSKRIDILIFNEEEHNHFKKTGISNSKILVKTLGKNGSMANEHTAKPFKTKVIDTTGAGDAFNAGFLFSHMLGNDLYDCLLFGNKLGAYICGHQGANSSFTLNEIKNF
ncbi:MAG: ribokinase [Kosmotogales bacterium]|nr:ribokinase [Kosmotogales bacterium]